MKIEYGELKRIDPDDIVKGHFTIPDGVTSIGDLGFCARTVLTSVKIPESVKYIGSGAFYGFTSLRSIEIPKSVTLIGDNAFRFCYRLESVNIPKSVTNIGTNAFRRCDRLTSVTFSAEIELERIGDWSFCGCEKLKGIEIPASVTRIGHAAFCDCPDLTSVKIPASVTVIGDFAFSGCTSLRSVTIPASIEYIGDCAFAKCEKLKSTTAAYKAFCVKDGEIFERQNNQPYKVGRKTFSRGKLDPCNYCTNIFDIFNDYYGTYGKDFVIALCDVSEENVGHGNDSKRCARWIKPTKILSRKEVVRIMNGKTQAVDMTLETVIEQISETETADVAPVRHAHWGKVSDKYPRYVCTACNHLFNNRGFNFCPHCGAKMDDEIEK